MAIERADQVVIVDTCSVLDLARAAWRDRSPSADVRAARRLQDGAVDPARLVIAIIDATKGEFDNHIRKVELEGHAELTNLRKRITRADEVADHLGIARLTETTIGWSERILKAGVELAHAIINQAVVINVSDNESARAVHRAVDSRPPGRRGSVSTFDCMITESAVRVASARPAGTTYLLTGNSKDFGGKNGKRLDPDLEIEFGKAGLVFTTTWSEVAGRIGFA